mgnify:CR=1 FL=1|tara:strand:+ start:7142 stop:8491 length:1350 start_codon:yes stop_codon:yes gene_type:complete
MALEKQIARLSKMLVEADDITFENAQSRLRSMTLEIVVGENTSSPAAHCAILTAISVGRRSFIGGVRVVGSLDQPLKSALPFVSKTLRDAVAEAGASEFDGDPSQKLIVGTVRSYQSTDGFHIWWKGWRAGANRDVQLCDEGKNPLSGIVGGALGVGLAFQAARNSPQLASEIDLWPAEPDVDIPAFDDVWLPKAAWLIGLGNLGQAFLWALSALPYSVPADVSLMLQDRDRVSEENWVTSILVRDETFGSNKTKIAEEWALRKGFNVRRVDRFLSAADRLHGDDPRLAFSGVDSIEARKIMDRVGFDCIIDAGLGRRANDFDRFRITAFDQEHSIAKHFDGQSDAEAPDEVPDQKAYHELEKGIGQCGAVEIAGTSVAAAFVSAAAAACAIARSIAVTSGCPIPVNEVRRLSVATSRAAPAINVSSRGLGHAGKPVISSASVLQIEAA